MVKMIKKCSSIYIRTYQFLLVFLVLVSPLLSVFNTSTATAQNLHQEQAAQILIEDAVQALNIRDTSKASLHLSLAGQQLESLGNNSISVQTAKIFIGDAIQALKKNDINTAIVRLNLAHQQLNSVNRSPSRTPSLTPPTTTKDTEKTFAELAESIPNETSSISNMTSAIKESLPQPTPFNTYVQCTNLGNDGYYLETGIFVKHGRCLSYADTSFTVGNMTGADNMTTENKGLTKPQTPIAPYSLPSNPPPAIKSYQSGLCLSPKTHYEIDVCKGFLDGSVAGKYDLQNGNRHSGSEKFMGNPPSGFGNGYLVGYSDGYNYFCPAETVNGTSCANTNYTGENVTGYYYGGNNMTSGNMTSGSSVSSGNYTYSNMTPNPIEHRQLVPQQNRINWGEICRNPLVDTLITEPCDTLTTPDGYTLTPEGERVLRCLAGGAVLGVVKPEALTAARALGPAVGCGGTTTGTGGTQDNTGNNDMLGNILGKLLPNKK
jgi:hypothetical protein